jgi:sugar (pentulose or hexulose) kinase
MLQAKTDYILTAATAAIWAATWPGDEGGNNPADTIRERWPEPEQIRGYEPAEQYTDRRYDPATDNGQTRPDEDRNFWDRL